MHTKFWLGNLKGRYHFLGIYGRIILMDLQEIGQKGVKWIHLAQDRDRWHALMNTVMNL
jgi:hypothetical protein